MKEDFWHDMKECLLVLVLTIVLCMLFTGCSPKVVTKVVEHTRTDSVYVESVKRDSVLIQDSVFVKQKGDTIWLERWKKERIVQIKDSIQYVTKIDSIPYTVEVEKKLTKKELFMQKTGELFWSSMVVLLVVLGISALVFYILRKK